MTKRGGMGKRKGSGFERKVCEQLSRWIAPDNDETLFWRSAMSGGRATNRFKRGIKTENQTGDITCIHPKGSWLTDVFVIECKFYRDLDIKTALLNQKGKLIKFWKEVCEVAKRNDRLPMLIAKENQTKALLILSWKGTTLFGMGGQSAFILCGHAKPETMHIHNYTKFLEKADVSAHNLRPSSRLKSTKRRSVEPVPVVKKASKKIRDKATLDIGGHHKRERPARFNAR